MTLFGNSLFDFNVHAAAVLPRVERLEFSDFPGLASNGCVRQPVRFGMGFARPPEMPGHGLDPCPDAFQEFSRPES